MKQNKCGLEMHPKYGLELMRLFFLPSEKVYYMYFKGS